MESIIQHCIGCAHYDRMHNRCRIGVNNPNECEDWETNDHFDRDD